MQEECQRILYSDFKTLFEQQTVQVATCNYTYSYTPSSQPRELAVITPSPSIWADGSVSRELRYRGDAKMLDTN
jgi:hypothetical protein